jgi:hypothetical protein
MCYGPAAHGLRGTELVINQNIVFNKYRQMKILGEELCMESVQYTNQDTNLDEWIIKPYISMGGKNIRQATPYAHCLGNEYYQRKFDKVREFRVHCFLWNDEQVPFIQEKVVRDPDQLCWNEKQGGVFRHVYQQGLNNGKYSNTISHEQQDRMSAMSIKALKLLKYDFGGVDLGMDRNGNFKIFEVNSRMGIKEKSFFTYKPVMCRLKTLNINRYREERWL